MNLVNGKYATGKLLLAITEGQIEATLSKRLFKSYLDCHFSQKD